MSVGFRTAQLRRYEIHPGMMSRFVEEVFPYVIEARGKYGFRPLFAVAAEDGAEFTWAVAHDGDFAAAEAAYYDSPERAAMPVDPKECVAAAHVRLVTVLDVRPTTPTTDT